MEQYEGDNIGSIYELLVIEHYKIQKMNPVTLLPGASWLNVPIRDQSGRIRSRVSASDNGPIYSYQVEAFINHMREEVNVAMDIFHQGIAVLKVTDMNDRVYILGEPNRPVTMEESGDSGQGFASENGTSFDFSISMDHRAPSA